VKKFSTLALSVLGFILIAAPTAVEYHNVFLNGRMLGHAANLNGIIAISVADLAKAGGGTLTLEEAGLTLTGNTLSASSRVADAYKQKISDPQKKAVVGASAAAAKVNIKGESHALWGVNPGRPQGTISAHAFKFQNQWWVPLSDVATAFGGSFTISGNLAPGQAIQLNFAKTPNAILIGL
jgi:hypothetical protein